jgi:signal transduction histidine kinase
MAYAVFTVPIGIAQWRRTRNKPLERAALKWLYFVSVLACGFIATANNLPIALGFVPLVSNVPVLLSVVVLFGGIALGIVRYKLFNLDRWWFEAWMWGLGGVLVIALDALLLWFNASFGVALGMALALAGWVWFPLRQWLWRKVSPAAKQTVEQHLPRMIDTVFAARTAQELQRNWHDLLRDIYAPLNLCMVAEAVQRPAIVQDGLVLRVPGLEGGESIELHHGHKGQRLFSSADVQLAASLHSLVHQAAQVRRAQDAHAAREQAQQREKELLVQDLHDGLGGIVTNIGLLAELGCKEQEVGGAHKTLGTIAGLARESVNEIRGFMHTIEDTDADWHDVAADLRLCARGMLEPHAIEKEFVVELRDQAPPPDGILRMNLFRVFKEVLNNVVKHARARHVRIKFEVNSDHMRLAVSDDGVGFAMGACTAAELSGKCRGLRHLRERARALGGDLSLQSAPGAGTTVTLIVPIPVKSPAPGVAAETQTP